MDNFEKNNARIKGFINKAVAKVKKPIKLVALATLATIVGFGIGVGVNMEAKKTILVAPTPAITSPMPEIKAAEDEPEIEFNEGRSYQILINALVEEHITQQEMDKYLLETYESYFQQSLGDDTITVKMLNLAVYDGMDPAITSVTQYLDMQFKNGDNKTIAIHLNIDKDNDFDNIDEQKRITQDMIELVKMVNCVGESDHVFEDMFSGVVYDSDDLAEKAELYGKAIYKGKALPQDYNFYTTPEKLTIMKNHAAIRCLIWGQSMGFTNAVITEVDHMPAEDLER